MKKTVSMMLAIIVAAITVCTFAVSAFANPEITVPSDDRFNPATTATTTKAPETTTTTKAPETTTTTKAPETTTTTKASDTTTTTAEDEIHTIPEGSTVIDEGTTKAPVTTAKPTTTKKPAPNVSEFPDTGSANVVPVIALLALAAGTVAVVKTKKDN